MGPCITAAAASIDQAGNTLPAHWHINKQTDKLKVWHLRESCWIEPTKHITVPNGGKIVNPIAYTISPACTCSAQGLPDLISMYPLKKAHRHSSDIPSRSRTPLLVPLFSTLKLCLFSTKPACTHTLAATWLTQNHQRRTANVDHNDNALHEACHLETKPSHTVDSGSCPS